VAAAAELEAQRLTAGSGGRARGAASGVAGAEAASGRRPGPGPIGEVGGSRPGRATVAPRRPATRREKLSKDAYRRQKAAVDAELTRLGLRKSHLELALSDPAVGANFVELRRITSELADIEAALAAAEDAWLELEERAP
jgi:hypothetical protein